MEGVASGQDVSAEVSAHLRIEDPLSLKQAPGIGFQSFGPFIGVISGGIASGEDVSEGAGNVRALDGGRDLEPR